MLENNEVDNTLRAKRERHPRIRQAVSNIMRIVGILTLAVMFYGIINHFPVKNSGPKAPQFSPSVNWSSNGNTLIIFVRHGCHFCLKSHDFFERLVAISKAHPDSTHILFVTPDSHDVSMLDLPHVSASVEVRNGVDIQDYVAATPTMFLVDRRGEIMHIWSGFIPQEREGEVIRAAF